MKKTIAFLLFITFTVLLTNCSSNKTKIQTDSFKSEESEKEDEDGIREAQEMEFEMTRDLKLGYITRKQVSECV